MKKRFLLFAAMLLLLLLPAMALAEGETTGPDTTTPAPDATATPKPQSGASLAIDDINIYSGMTKAYQVGYEPQVKKGVVTLVLPLVATGTIAGNELTATPGLGDPSSSPFVFKNYQKTVRLADNAINGGPGKVSSYLVRFDLPMRSGRINGVYPVTVAIQAVAGDGSVVQQSFSFYVTVKDGKNPNATPKPEEPKPQPKIIVSGYNVEPSPVMAGTEFMAKVALRNTSEIEAVRNMTVTVSCDSPDFSLENAISTIFIDSLDKGGTTDIEIKYKTGLKTPAQRYMISLAIEYENASTAVLSSSGTIPVMVEQPLRVKLEAPKIAEQVNAGDTLPLSFQVMNLGRSMVYNVRCELGAPGLIPTGTAFIGNMEAGTAKTGEMDVFIGTKDMSEGHENDEKYGLTSGTITLIYEDESGKEYTEKTDISTTINEPVISPTTIEPKQEPAKAGQWWVSILIGAVVAAGLTMYLIYRGKRQGKAS